MAWKGSMTHCCECCECCECTSRNNHTHSTNTLWQTHNMQSGVPQRVCTQTELGCSQRADRVNSRVNCVSGGPYKDETLPPGDMKHYSTALCGRCIQTPPGTHESPQLWTNSSSVQRSWYWKHTSGMKKTLSWVTHLITTRQTSPALHAGNMETSTLKLRRCPIQSYTNTTTTTIVTLNLMFINYTLSPSSPCTWIVTLQLCLQKHLWVLFIDSVLYHAHAHTNTKSLLKKKSSRKTCYVCMCGSEKFKRLCWLCLHVCDVVIY